MSKDITIKIDLSAPVTIASAKDALWRFIGWWGCEVLELLPKAWNERLRARSTRFSLIVTGNGWSLECPEGTTIALDQRVPPLELREELSRRAPDSLRRGINVVIPQKNLLFRRQNFPHAAAAKLQQVIRLQLDRLSPFRGDDVQFFYWILADESSISQTGSPREGNIAVEIAILPKRQLTDIESSVRALGLTPRIFRVADCPASFAPVGLPWTKHTQRRAMISAFGASFIAAAMILSPNLRTLEIAELHAQIASVRPLVERAQAERSELSHYQLPAQAVSADRAAAFDLLLDLTKRLPDSISVSRLQVRGQDVIIEGRSTTLVDVRTLITRSPVLIDVRSTTMAPLADRFSLTAKLKPGISGDH